MCTFRSAYENVNGIIKHGDINRPSTNKRTETEAPVHQNWGQKS